MVALEQRGQAQQMLRRLCRAGGALARPYQRSNVVADGREGEQVHLDVLGEHILVGDNAGQLKIAVVDGAGWVGVRYEGISDGDVEFSAPNHGASTRNKPYAAHAVAAGVNRTKTGRLVFDDFFDPGRASVEIVGKCGKVLELLTYGPRDANAMLSLMLL